MKIELSLKSCLAKAGTKKLSRVLNAHAVVNILRGYLKRKVQCSIQQTKDFIMSGQEWGLIVA